MAAHTLAAVATQCVLATGASTDSSRRTLIVIDTLVPIVMLDEPNRAIASVTPQHILTSIFTHQIIGTLIHVHAVCSRFVRNVALITNAVVASLCIPTLAIGHTQAWLFNAFVDVEAPPPRLSIPLWTGALEAAGRVDAFVRAVVRHGRAFVKISTTLLVDLQHVPLGTRAGEAAGRVLTGELAGRGAEQALVFVYTTSAREVGLVAGVADTAIGTHGVNTTPVLTGAGHRGTFVDVCSIWVVAGP